MAVLDTQGTVLYCIDKHIEVLETEGGQQLLSVYLRTEAPTLQEMGQWLDNWMYVSYDNAEFVACILTTMGT